MSSLHSDRGWLFVSFMLHGEQVRLYFKIRDKGKRENARNKTIRKVRALIDLERWGDLARQFPRCKELAAFRVAAPAEVTFGSVCAAFLAQKQLATSAGTADYYRSILATHLMPSPLTLKPIRSITANDIIALCGKVQKAGHAARAGKVRQTFSAIFRYAMNEHLVDENPVQRTAAIRSTVRDPNPFTPDEIERILEAANGVVRNRVLHSSGVLRTGTAGLPSDVGTHRDLARGWQARIVTVAIETGMRPAELFGLKRKNIDLINRKIYVRQNLTRHGEGDLKTRKSHRTINMTTPVRVALKAQLAAVQLKSEWLWPDTYHRKHGPHSAHNFSRRNWPAILKRAGVEHREFLQCRHTYAITMLRSGADWDYIAEQMGTSIAMLHDHYWRLLPGKSRKPELRKVR